MSATLTTPLPLENSHYDLLDEILDDLRQRMDEVPQWEFCEGFMAALICCRRPIAPDEYFGALLSDPATGTFGPHLFASPAQHDQFLQIWQRRWAEVQAALDAPVQSLEDERCYAPEVIDVRGAVASMNDEERAEMLQQLGGEALPSFAQVWALGFMYAVETWPEEWQPPRDKEAADWVEDAMLRIVALTEPDEDEPSISMFGDDCPPSVSQARLDAYGDAIWAVYDLRDTWKHVGPRVPTVHKTEQPGRNDPCSCGSGKKFKKCCGG
jgi:uncharacterized protein